MGRRVLGILLIAALAAGVAVYATTLTRPVEERAPHDTAPADGAPPEPPAGPPVPETVASRLEVPWGTDFAPGGSLFFTERPGRVRLWRDGQLTTLAVLDDTAAVGEGGLLGLALHPRFAEQPFVYVYQTYRAGRGLANRVLRFRYDTDAARLVDRQVLLDGIAGGEIHDGGQLRFGPDGLLYVTTGDAARADDAQDPGVLHGKILRLEADGGIPADNPFGPDSPVFSYGHRNPEGLAFDAPGRLYATEHGSSGLDELNLVEAGANYGWPRVRGADHGAYAAPVRVYDRLPPAGAAVYTGPYAPWRGSLFFGTLGFTEAAGRHLRRVRLGEDGRAVVGEEELFRNEFGRIRAVAMGPDGCLYFGTSNRDGRGEPAPDDDRILRLCMPR